MRRTCDGAVEIERLVARHEPRPVPSGIQIEIDVGRHSRCSKRLGQLSKWPRMVGRHAQLQIGKQPLKGDHTTNIRPDRVISQDHVPHAAVREHFRFRDRRRFVSPDARGQHHLDHRRHFVSLAVGPQSIGRTGDPQHRRQISLHQRPENHERRRQKLLRSPDQIIVRHESHSREAGTHRNAARTLQCRRTFSSCGVSKLRGDTSTIRGLKGRIFSC